MPIPTSMPREVPRAKQDHLEKSKAANSRASTFFFFSFQPSPWHRDLACPTNFETYEGACTIVIAHYPLLNGAPCSLKYNIIHGGTSSCPLVLSSLLASHSPSARPQGIFVQVVVRQLKVFLWYFWYRLAPSH